MPTRRCATTATTLALCCPLLWGCGGAGTYTFRVTDADGQPARHALVEAVALESGTVPLPVNDQTMPELMNQIWPSTVESDWTDDNGVARLALLGDRQHRLTVDPSPMAEPMPGAERVWLFDPETGEVTLAGEGDGDAGFTLQRAR